MKSKLILQYGIIVIMFCMPIILYGQTKQDTVQNLFSHKEIKQLSKGDKLINKGLSLDHQLDSLIDAINNTGQSYSKLSNAEKNQITNSLRALRVYYVGMSKKSDVYLKHIKNKNFKNEQGINIAETYNTHNTNAKKAKSYYNKSRDTRKINDALKFAVLSVELHKTVQSDLYQQLSTNQNASVESQQSDEIIATKPPANQTAVPVIIANNENTASTDIPIEKDTTTVINNPKPTPPVEAKPEIKQPKVYFTIQIMADRKPASETQINTIYKGKRKTIMNKGDGWYRYSVGKFHEYQEAYETMKSEKIKGYVVAYDGEQRISTSQAKAILNSTP